MLPVTRRELLKALAAAGIVGTTLPLGMRRLAFAAAPSAQPILIVLHLRGGCDGLNFVSPASDPDFIAARASELRVVADGKDAGHALGNGPAPGIDFRLHASAGGLAELYQNGNLAFIHACGLTDTTRSHFVATDMIESGVGSEAGLSRAQSGWLARVVESSHEAAPGGLQAVAVNGAIAGDLQGLDHVLAVPDLNYGLGYVGGPAVATAIWDMYTAYPGPVGEAGRTALQLPTIIDQRIERDPQGHVAAYQPANGANYDSAGGFANTLKTLARLIKMDIGLQAVTLDYGGWDTHEYQAGRFNGLIGPLSNGLAAFWNDMSAWHDRIVLVTLTEFGRRLRSNKSGGTDHGRAGLMAVLGGDVRGGRFYGKWPGLKSEQLEEGVDLAVTTDYRQVLTEVLDHTGGRKSAEAFPDYRYPGGLGLF
jgi:uncharacterized protein (DUF1501 family)